MIGVIADDLTGAAELGAVGLKYGLSAEIVISGIPSGKIEMVCCDTASRSLSAEDAAAKTAEAAASLRNVGADWIYKEGGLGASRQSDIRGPGVYETARADSGPYCSRQPAARARDSAWQILCSWKGYP